MTPTTAAVIADSAPRQRLVAAQRFDERRADEDPEEARRERHPGGEQAAERAGDAAVRAPPGSRNAARKPTNCSTMISGPGVVSAMPRPSSISPGGEPADSARPPAARHRRAPHRRRRTSPSPSCEKNTAMWLKTFAAPSQTRRRRDRHEPQREPDARPSAPPAQIRPRVRGSSLPSRSSITADALCPPCPPPGESARPSCRADESRRRPRRGRSAETARRKRRSRRRRAPRARS